MGCSNNQMLHELLHWDTKTRTDAPVPSDDTLLLSKKEDSEECQPFTINTSHENLHQAKDFSHQNLQPNQILHDNLQQAMGTTLQNLQSSHTLHGNLQQILDPSRQTLQPSLLHPSGLPMHGKDERSVKGSFVGASAGNGSIHVDPHLYPCPPKSSAYLPTHTTVPTVPFVTPLEGQASDCAPINLNTGVPLIHSAIPPTHSDVPSIPFMKPVEVQSGACAIIHGPALATSVYNNVAGSSSASYSSAGNIPPPGFTSSQFSARAPPPASYTYSSHQPSHDVIASERYNLHNTHHALPNNVPVTSSDAAPTHMAPQKAPLSDMTNQYSTLHHSKATRDYPYFPRKYTEPHAELNSAPTVKIEPSSADLFNPQAYLSCLKPNEVTLKDYPQRSQQHQQQQQQEPSVVPPFMPETRRATIESVREAKQPDGSNIFSTQGYYAHPSNEIHASQHLNSDGRSVLSTQDVHAHPSRESHPSQLLHSNVDNVHPTQSVHLHPQNIHTSQHSHPDKQSIFATPVSHTQNSQDTHPHHIWEGAVHPHHAEPSYFAGVESKNSLPHPRVGNEGVNQRYQDVEDISHQPGYWDNHHPSPHQQHPSTRVYGVAQPYQHQSVASVPPSPRVTLRQSGRGHDFPHHYQPHHTPTIKVPAHSNGKLAYQRMPGRGGQTRLVFKPL